MKKCNSAAKYGSHAIYSSNEKKHPHPKTKTTSTIIHTQQEQQQTTKKSTLTKTSSVAKMANSSCKTSKTNLIKIQTRNLRASSANDPQTKSLTIKNQQLLNQNRLLRDQFCKLQQSHLKDKSKIQHLLARMSQLKSQSTPSQAEHNQDIFSCNNRYCHQKRKQLQVELHKQRIKVYQLEQDKKKWDRSREQLKNQYGDLLVQIQQLRAGNC